MGSVGVRRGRHYVERCVGASGGRIGWSDCIGREEEGGKRGEGRGGREE